MSYVPGDHQPRSESFPGQHPQPSPGQAPQHPQQQQYPRQHIPQQQAPQPYAPQRQPRQRGYGLALSSLIVGIVGTTATGIILIGALAFVGLILVMGAPATVREELIAGGANASLFTGIPLGLAGLVLGIAALIVAKTAAPHEQQPAVQTTAGRPGDRVAPRRRSGRSFAIVGIVFSAIPLAIAAIIIPVGILLAAR